MYFSPYIIRILCWKFQSGLLFLAQGDLIAYGVVPGPGSIPIKIKLFNEDEYRKMVQVCQKNILEYANKKKLVPQDQSFLKNFLP